MKWTMFDLKELAEKDPAMFLFVMMAIGGGTTIIATLCAAIFHLGEYAK